LNNVLNVISNRGLVSGDEKICDICASLAAMLRYSTGNTKRLSSVREELEHLRHYLYLIGTRYEEKLRFSINVDENLVPVHGYQAGFMRTGDGLLPKYADKHSLR
jgi:two-component system sensor histidine kinase YesM